MLMKKTKKKTIEQPGVCLNVSLYCDTSAKVSRITQKSYEQILMVFSRDASVPRSGRSD